MAISGESLSDLMRDLKQQASPYQASLDLNSIPNFDYRSEFEKIDKSRRIVHLEEFNQIGRCGFQS